MKKFLCLVFLLSFTLLSFDSKATVGCLIGSSLHTSTNGTGSGKTYFDNSPSIGASGFCLRNGTSTSPCQVRTWYWFFWSYGSNGIMGDFGPSNPPMYCPIDSEVWLLVLGIGGFGAYFLSRKGALV